MATRDRVLRIPRAERKAVPNFALLHVSGVESGELLDLRLVGTDSSDPFAYTLKHSKTSKLKAKNSSTTQEQWEAVLAAILLGVEEDGSLAGVEAVAEVEVETSITIIFQKRIEGITQKLGQIVLVYEPNEDIELYEWAGLLLNTNDTLKDENTTLKASIKAKDEQITKLEEALSELTTLKTKNEDSLIEKFSLLLNEKKMKIRDQQTLLASANIDQIKPEAEDMEVDEPVSAGPSRPRKRKAGRVVEDDSDEDKGTVKMEADEAEAEGEPDSDEADQQTASETESDSDTMPSSSVAKIQTKGKAAAPPKPKATSPPARRTRGASAQPQKKTNDEDLPLPPPRALPFQKKATKAAPPPPTIPDGSETESDDDEL